MSMFVACLFWTTPQGVPLPMTTSGPHTLRSGHHYLTYLKQSKYLHGRVLGELVIERFEFEFHRLCVYIAVEVPPHVAKRWSVV